MSSRVSQAIAFALKSTLAGSAAIGAVACPREPVAHPVVWLPDAGTVPAATDAGNELDAEAPSFDAGFERPIRPATLMPKVDEDGYVLLPCAEFTRRRNPQHRAGRVDLSSLARELGALEATFEPESSPRTPNLFGAPPRPITREELVVRFQDRIVRVQTEEDLKSLLGKIDGVAKAALYIGFTTNEYWVDCGKGKVLPDRVELEVSTTRSSGSGCPRVAGQQVVTRDDTVLLRVGADFTTKELSRKTTRIHRTIFVAGPRVPESRQVSPIEWHQYSLAGMCPVPGRAPESLAFEPSLGMGSLPAWLASSAYLEAAAVHAFQILAVELNHHDAPDPLVERCLVAAQDEVAHARAMTHLAAKHGVVPPEPVMHRHKLRGLAEVALENAREGCVRETFAALVAHHQANHATDPDIAQAFQRIALDETRHAELSWDVAEWLGGQLSERDRDRVQSDMSKAWEELCTQSSADVPFELIDGAGLPEPQLARTLAIHLRRALGSHDTFSG